MRKMDFSNYEVGSIGRDRELSMSRAFPVLMRKVYVWMTLALVISGLTAYGVATSPGLLTTLYSSQGLIIGMVIAEFAIVIALSAAINRISLPVATLMFVVYSVLTGALLSSVFVIYTMSSIATVFFITAGTFAAMAVVGYTTKKDLSSMGRILLMALLGLIIASVVNMFVKSSGLELIVSYVGVLIFVGLTAYDTQKIKQLLMDADEASETMQKVALLGALSLYLDFINLFLYLIRIFGAKRD